MVIEDSNLGEPSLARAIRIDFTQRRDSNPHTTSITKRRDSESNRNDFHHHSA